MKRLWAIVTVALLLAVLGTTCLTQSWIRADWWAANYRDRINAWTSGQTPWTNQDLLTAQRDIELAINASPNDAGLLDMLAALHALHGQQAWDDGQARQAAFTDAVKLQRHSIHIRPVAPVAWANLAFYCYASGAPLDETIAAWRQAAAQGMNDQSTQITLLNVALGIWSEAPNDLKNWVRSMKHSKNQMISSRFPDWLAYYKVSL